MSQDVYPGYEFYCIYVKEELRKLNDILYHFNIVLH